MFGRCAAALPGKASARVGAGQVARSLQRVGFLALVISDAALLFECLMADGQVHRYAAPLRLCACPCAVCLTSDTRVCSQNHL